MAGEYDDSDAHNASDAETQSDSSKYPHLKQHTPDSKKVSWSNFVLRANRGAYSEREYRMYEEVGSSDIEIKNLDKRAVKKGPDAGSTGR